MTPSLPLRDIPAASPFPPGMATSGFLPLAFLIIPGIVSRFCSFLSLLSSRSDAGTSSSPEWGCLSIASLGVFFGVSFVSRHLSICEPSLFRNGRRDGSPSRLGNIYMTFTALKRNLFYLGPVVLIIYLPVCFGYGILIYFKRKGYERELCKSGKYSPLQN